MARYRKIDTRMWGDTKFRALSSEAKYLWIFLLTGPHTTILPGLFRAGEMALAEELGWQLKGFREAFAKLLKEGLVKADWNARVVWIPNAIKYNSPENPNVVRGWRDSWDEIPECPLKAEAYERFKTFTERLGEGFGKGFQESCTKRLANQEQEQEQEQEQNHEQEKTIASNPDRFDDAIKQVFDYYLERTGRDPRTYEFTAIRKRRGATRLNECLRKTGNDLEKAKRLMKLAIDGLVASDFHMGRDQKTAGTKYCEWEKHVFKSYEQMESWWNKPTSVPAARPNGRAAEVQP
jgi:hypothetical protein